MADRFFLVRSGRRAIEDADGGGAPNLGGVVLRQVRHRLDIAEREPKLFIQRSGPERGKGRPRSLGVLLERPVPRVV